MATYDRTVFPTFSPDAATRWHRNRPFLIVGTIGVVVGGFAAAVAGAVDWGHGAWTAAFLVLVVGVAQLVLGAAQAALAPELLGSKAVTIQFLLWNVGCLTVIGGVQVDSTLVVAMGSISFLGALAMSEGAVRRRSPLTGTAKTLLTVYRVLLAFLLVSVCVGIVLSLAGN